MKSGFHEKCGVFEACKKVADFLHAELKRVEFRLAYFFLPEAVFLYIMVPKGRCVGLKKREFAIALSLLAAVSTLCIKGMKKVGERLSRKPDEQNFEVER